MTGGKIAGGAFATVVLLVLLILSPREKEEVQSL